MARILFIDQYATLGGGQRILLDVVEAFAEEGHACVVALPGKGEVTEALDRLGVRHEPLPVPELSAGKKGLPDFLRFLAGSRKLARAIKALSRDVGADIVYVNGPRCILGAVLAKVEPVVIAIHLIHGGFERRLLAWCFARPEVRLVTFCSRFAMEPFAGLAKGRIFENWVSPAILEAPDSRAASRRELGLEEREVAVGVLGRISPFKGQAFLCKALLPVLREASPIRLFVAGAKDHETQGEDLPKSPFIREMGKVPAPARFLDAMDILVVPSLWEEPFGLVAIEGMARGLPVVATRSGCLPEIVEDGTTGLVVPKTEEGLRGAIESLTQDRAKRESMGSAGRAKTIHRFEPRRRLSELIGLVLDLKRELPGRPRTS
ncbi:MAG TPA: glycosyltransferase family 4 protein [Fimbriimonadaceae bacterium]|nr:glycosyltransferase family 4 protein [Fimbriimonadaceae bacterium]